MSSYDQDWTSATTPGQTPKINSIFDFSAEALGQLKVWLEQAGLNLPISNIIGFQNFTVQEATVDARETRTNTAYGDLATAGPALTLPDGKYLIGVGGQLQSSVDAAGAWMSFQVNSTAASDVDAAVNENQYLTTPAHFSIKTLSNGGSNVVTAKYRSSGAATADFGNRWILALRYANS